MAGHLKKKTLIIIHYQSSLSQLPGFTYVLEKEGCSQTRGFFFLCSCYDTKLNFSHYTPLVCAPLMLPCTYTLTVYFALLVLHWFIPATIFIPLFSLKWCTCTFLVRTTLDMSITSIYNHHPVKQERKLPINRKGKFMLLLFDKAKICVYLGCVCVCFPGKATETVHQQQKVTGSAGYDLLHRKDKMVTGSNPTFISEFRF